MSNNLNILTNSNSKNSTDPKPKTDIRALFARYLPFLILLGFLSLFWVLFGNKFASTRLVEVEKVITIQSDRTELSSETDSNIESSKNESSYDAPTLFQASGWFEAAPYSHRAIALYSGFIKEVHIPEGEMVNKGQLIATMIDDDVILDLESAKAEYDRNLALVLAEQSAEKEAILRYETWNLVECFNIIFTIY